MEAAATKKSNHGANVCRWREWRGINQDVLAEQIGVSQATLCKYEKKETLDQETLEKIATALNIPVEAITEIEFGTAINIVANTFTDFKDNAVANQNYPTFNTFDKITELYERMLKEKDSVIELLKEVLEGRK